MNPRSPLLPALFAVLGLLFLAFAVFYATTDTHLFASEFGRHYKHAIVAAILGVLSFVAANFARHREA